MVVWEEETKTPLSLGSWLVAGRAALPRARDLVMTLDGGQWHPLGVQRLWSAVCYGSRQWKLMGVGGKSRKIDTVLLD